MNRLDYRVHQTHQQTEGVKFKIVTRPDIETPAISPAITPTDPIIYEKPIWRQDITFNDTDTLVNQKVRIDLSHDGHDILIYPNEQSYNTCSNADILVEETANLNNYDINLDEIETRYIGCSVDKHDYEV